MLVFLTRFWTYANSPARSGRRGGWIGAEAGGKSHTRREGAASGLGLIGIAVATAWLCVMTASRSAVEAEAEGEAAFGEPTEEGKMKSSRFIASAQAEPVSTESGPLTVLGGVVAALECAGAAGFVGGAPSDDFEGGKGDGRSCHDGG